MATAADKGDVLVGKVFNFLCDFGLVKFRELLKKPSPLTTKFSAHELVVWIKEHLSTDPRFAVMEARGKIISVKIVSKVRMCCHYVERGKCRSKGECKFWHVCKDYVEGNCEKTCSRGLSHDFYDAENADKAEQLGSGRKLQSGTVRRIVAVNLPQVCSAYIQGSCDKASCQCLHLCAGFINKTCFNSHECTQSHNLRSRHNRSILWKNGFKSSSRESDVLCNILLPKNAVVPKNPENNGTAAEQNVSKFQAEFGCKCAGPRSTSKPNLSTEKSVLKSQTGNQRQGPQAYQSTPHSLNLNVLSSPDEEEGFLSSDDNERVDIDESCLLNLHGTERRAGNGQAIKTATKGGNPQLRRNKGMSQSVGNIHCSSEGQSLFPRVTQGLPPPPVKRSIQGDPPAACNRSMSAIPPLCGLTCGPTRVQQPDIGKPQMKGVVNCGAGEEDPRNWVGKGRGMPRRTSHQDDGKRPGNPAGGCSGFTATGSKAECPPSIQSRGYPDQGAESVVSKTSAAAAADSEDDGRASERKAKNEPEELSSPDPQRSRKAAEEFEAVGQSSTAEKRNFSKSPGKQPGESQPVSSMSSWMVGSTSGDVASKVNEMAEDGKRPPLQKTMVSSDERTSTSSSVSSRIEPVEISEKQVFECICKEYDCSAKFFDIVSERVDLFPNGKADAEAWFRKDTRKKSFIITEGENKEILKITAFSSKLRLCPNGSNCRKDECSFFHVCKDFIAGCCELGACCVHEHEFRNYKDKQLVSNLQVLNSFTEEQLGRIFRASTPHVCLDYNNGKCQKGEKCNKVHICKDFVQKHCRSGACSLDHADAYETPHTKALAEKFRMSVLTLKRVIVAPQPPFADHEPIDYSAHICPDYILGKCKNGPHCVKHHCLLPYQWQYRNQVFDQQWQSFPDDVSRDLERLFCDPDKDSNVTIRLSCRTPFRIKDGSQVYVDFENMKLSATTLGGGDCAADADCDSIEMRRLSTESYGTIPGDALATAWTWYWQAKSNAWIPCGSGSEDERAATQREIETAFLSKDGCCYYCSHQEPYKLYFQSKPMYQKNKRLNTKTLIRRRPKFRPEDEIRQLKSSQQQKPPKQPKPSKQPRSNSTTTLLPHWSPMPPGKDFMRVRLSPGSAEFKTVEKKFRRTMPEHEAILVQIERVQNPFMLEKFNRKKESMEAKSKGSSLKKSLFHGTNSEMVDKICKQNFDWRHCVTNNTVYGQGSSFALYASYVNRYSRHAYHDSNRFMFLANVLVGSYMKGDSTMIRPPPKNPSDPKSDLFDSLVDDGNNPKIFVVFEIDQCYPSYVIEYMDILQDVEVALTPRGYPGASTSENPPSSCRVTRPGAAKAVPSPLRSCMKASSSPEYHCPSCHKRALPTRDVSSHPVADPAARFYANSPAMRDSGSSIRAATSVGQTTKGLLSSSPVSDQSKGLYPDKESSGKRKSSCVVS